ncbi:DNA-directed RNA polymerase subunit beta [Frankliniella fusca]|uniref:DNA-directed RNA polymerase subunit beta n=1 Tax=Frankliniella fusca TaxID=407009 RepID=A0AAE1GTE6_9NEOP|nr:DNA-directed RNA polymerase subunit beta [Frankliniella fusca]
MQRHAKVKGLATVAAPSPSREKCHRATTKHISSSSCLSSRLCSVSERPVPSRVHRSPPCLFPHATKTSHTI